MTVTLYSQLRDCPPGDRVITIGTFDGIHRGHQALISAAIARAHTRGIRSAAVTFEPAPAAVLRPDLFAGRICTPPEKIEILSATGLDEVLTLTFDLEMSRQSPEEFMNALVDATGLRELWVGEAFALGKNRVGNVDRLTEIGDMMGFQVSAMPRLEDDGNVISSSGIRRAILNGDVAQAHRELGRPFRMTGEVIHGAHLGRTIGYPTANVVPPADIVPVADGIYVSTTLLPGARAANESMTYVGTRPTVNSGDRLVETHLLGFDGDLYGQTISVDLLERLRGDAVFAGIDALIDQLKTDERATRNYFARRQKEDAVN